MILLVVQLPQAIRLLTNLVSYAAHKQAVMTPSAMRLFSGAPALSRTVNLLTDMHTIETCHRETIIWYLLQTHC